MLDYESFALSRVKGNSKIMRIWKDIHIRHKMESESRNSLAICTHIFRKEYICHLKSNVKTTSQFDSLLFHRKKAHTQTHPHPWYTIHSRLLVCLQCAFWRIVWEFFHQKMLLLRFYPSEAIKTKVYIRHIRVNNNKKPRKIVKFICKFVCFSSDILRVVI